MSAETASLDRAGAEEIDATLRLWRLAADACGNRRARPPRAPRARLRAEGEDVPGRGDGRHARPAPGGRVVAVADRRLGAHRARAGRSRDDRRLRPRRRSPGVPRPPRHRHPQRAGAGSDRRGARHLGRLGDRRAGQRRRPRRHLSPRRAALLGRRQGRRHAAGVERDRRRHPRRREGRTHGHQPEPRLGRERPVDRARRGRGGRIRVARRRRLGERRRPGQPARLPRGVPARHDGRRDRPERRGRALLEPVELRRPRRTRRRHPRRERPRAELEVRVGHELLVADGRRSGRVGLDGAAGSHRRPGGRGPPALRDGHRARGARPGIRVRHVERGRGARAPRPDPGSVRAERRHRRGRPERRPLRVQGARAHDRVPAIGPHRRQGRPLRGPPGRLPRLAPAPARASRRRSPPRPTATSPCTRPPREPSSAGSRPTAAWRSRRPRERASGSPTSTRPRADGRTSP